MYINIGTELLIKDKDILGIFDLDNTTVSKSTREYINNSSRQVVEYVQYKKKKYIIRFSCLLFLHIHHENQANNFQVL